MKTDVEIREEFLGATCALVKERYQIDRLPAAVQLMGNKYTAGGELCAGTVPLDVLLTEHWPSDAHFTMYTSPAETRLVKDGPCPGIQFGVAVFDLDFGDHTTIPTTEQFHELLERVIWHTPIPNVVYQTKRGARYVYRIWPINDPEVFEQAFLGLMNRLDESFESKMCGYELDKAAKDWTRLFRAPHVERDGVEEYGREVRHFHNRRIKLTRFLDKGASVASISGASATVVTGTTPVSNKIALAGRYNGTDKYTKVDFRISCLMANFREGSRNATLYKLAAYIIGRYEPISRQRLLQRARDKAAEAGLPDTEIEQVIDSADKRIARKAVSPCL